MIARAAGGKQCISGPDEGQECGSVSAAGALNCACQRTVYGRSLEVQWLFPYGGASRWPESGLSAPARCAANVLDGALCRSAEKKQELALPAAVVAGAAAMMSNPLVAEAGVTPSLRNLLGAHQWHRYCRGH